MNNKKIVVLVVSCDHFSDLWDPYFELFDRFWADCPFDKYLLSNYKNYPNDYGVKSLSIQKDTSWSSSLIKGLNQLSRYDYVLLLLEDLFFKNKVNTKKLEEVIDDFIFQDGNSITLFNQPLADMPFNELYGEISIGAPYRTTATFTLWKMSTLLDLLDESESAWGFEKVGARRSDNYSGFYSVHENIFNHIHGVVKGKWLFSRIKELNSLGIEIDNTREVMSGVELLKMKGYKLIRSLIFFFVPFKYRKKLIRLKKI